MKETKKPSLVTEAKQIMPYVERALNRLGFSDLEVSLSGFDMDRRQNEGVLIGEIIMGVYPDKYFEEKLVKVWPAFKSEKNLHNILGYCLEWSNSLDEICLREGTFCKVLSAAGHELGHIISPRIFSEYEEEKKAYAFHFAWSDAMFDVIKGFVMTPSKNVPSLHRAAFKYVKSLEESGYNPLQLYWDIVKDKEINPIGSIRL